VALSNTAHDIKSPVAAIALAFEVLESIFTSRDIDWRAANEDVVDIIRDAAKTMLFFKMTINRSVDFSKVRSSS
jgi:signal transduction histidine kinase